MSKDRYNQIIDEAYEDYRNHFLGYDDVPQKMFLYLSVKPIKTFLKDGG